jgi:hypothetical protein
MRQSARISVAPVNDSFRRLTASDAVFRAGRGLLMVEGLAIGVLGGVALAWSMGYTRFAADGIPMVGLKVTPPHAGLLLIVGRWPCWPALGDGPHLSSAHSQHSVGQHSVSSARSRWHITRPVCSGSIRVTAFSTAHCAPTTSLPHSVWCRRRSVSPDPDDWGNRLPARFGPEESVSHFGITLDRRRYREGPSLTRLRRTGSR